MHKITSLELLRTPILCLVQLSKWWECKATYAQKLLSQWEKVAKCNFKSKAQLHENVSFSWNKCFLQCRRQIFMSLSSFAEQVILELNCTKSISLELLRTPILCLVQLSKWWKCEATDAQKLLSQWEKVAKCNFKSKAQLHENVSFSWNKCFFAMQKTDFHEFELFCRTSHFRA